MSEEGDYSVVLEHSGPCVIPWLWENSDGAHAYRLSAIPYTAGKTGKNNWVSMTSVEMRDFLSTRKWFPRHVYPLIRLISHVAAMWQEQSLRTLVDSAGLGRC